MRCRCEIANTQATSYAVYCDRWALWSVCLAYLTNLQFLEILVQSKTFLTDQ